MATTANTQRSTPVPRGNHPAGRALVGLAADRSGADRSAGRPVASHGSARLCLVRGGGAAPVVGGTAEVLPFRAAAAPVVSEAAPGAVEEIAPLRLTRRGRRLVAGLVLVGGLGLAALAALAGPVVLGAAPAGSGLTLVGESSVVVQPGDTLWSIASDIAPGQDPRGVVDALQEANDMVGAGLVPGQVLLVP